MRSSKNNAVTCVMRSQLDCQLKDTVSCYLGIGTVTRLANVFDVTIKRDVFIKNSILLHSILLTSWATHFAIFNSLSGTYVKSIYIVCSISFFFFSWYLILTINLSFSFNCWSQVDLGILYLVLIWQCQIDAARTEFPRTVKVQRLRIRG